MLPTSNRQRGAILWGSPTGKSPLQVSATGLLGRAPAAILSAPRATSHGTAKKRSDTLLSGDVASPGKSSPPFGGAKPPGKTRNANSRPNELLDSPMAHWAVCDGSCCTIISGQPACPNCPRDAGLHRPGCANPSGTFVDSHGAAPGL